MQIELRDYQLDAVNKTKDAFTRGVRRVLLTAPARAGKTIIFSYLAKKSIEKGKATGKDKRVLVVCPTREIVFQCSDKLEKLGIEHGIIMSGEKDKPNCQVQIACAFSLPNKPQHSGWADLIIFDEAHKTRASIYQDIVEGNPRAYMIGVTATPFRTDGKALGKVYQECLSVVSVSELIERGYLVPPRVFSKPIESLSSIRVVGNDYHQGELEGIITKPSIMGDIYHEWSKRVSDRKTIIYCTSIKHSMAVRDIFTSHGINAVHVDGQMRNQDRYEVLQEFEHGDIQVVCNVDVLTEGYDCPPVSCVVMARPTKSRVLYIQACSRGMGSYTGKKDMILLDHAGVTHEFGLLTEQEDHVLSLYDVEKQKREKKEAKEEVFKMCKTCFGVMGMHEVKCKQCGAEYETQDRSIEQVEGDLVEIKEISKKKRKQEESGCSSLDDWKKLAVKRGYDKGWAFKRYSIRKARG